MFRQGLKRIPTRCGALPIAASTLNVLSRQPRVLVAPTLSLALKTPLAGVPAFRFYSDAPAAAATEAAEAPEERKRFADLEAMGIHANLVHPITRGLGYEFMTEVQAKTIEAALEGKDMVAQAKTGTGKTIAFLLPILQRMLNEDHTLASPRSRARASCGDIRGIILSPTRELAEQIATEARSLTRGTGLVVQCAVGGTQKRESLMQMRRMGCHLLVATPGRLNDLLTDTHAGVAAPNLAALVLDEADRMLDVGFADELESIMGALPDPAEKTRQTLLFSATIPSNVVSLARKMVRRDQFVFVQTIKPDEATTHERIPQKIVVANTMYNTMPALYELIQREMKACAEDPAGMNFKAIVYFSTTSQVEMIQQLDRAMRDRSLDPPRFTVHNIHGKLTQAQRTRASEQFRRSNSGILFSSDVTARGLDFPNVTHVIQVGLPPSAEQYVHRLGRTGRQDKAGKGWLIISNRDVRNARQMLGSFPIHPDKSLTTATISPDIAEEERPEVLKQVNKAYGVVEPEVLAQAYLSFFGQVPMSEIRQLVEDLNTWSEKGWGWEQPPAISPSTAAKRGFNNIPGLNIGSNNFPRRAVNSFDRNGGSGGYGRDNYGRDNYGRNNNNDRRNNNNDSGEAVDGFEQFESQLRRNNNNNNRGGRGGSGGGFQRFGGSRGGDRGGSRGGDRGGFRGGQRSGGNNWGGRGQTRNRAPVTNF